MKMSYFKVLVLSSLLLLSFTVLANPKQSDKMNLNYGKIEANLIEGLNSGNTGLSVSSAFMLGEIKSEKAVLPLTRLLRESENPKMRLIAALSLIKIGSERSVYVVKQAKRFNNDSNTRLMCGRLYNGYISSERIKVSSERDGHNSIALGDK